MGFLFASPKKEKVVAIFDIGSGSIGGAIVHIPLGVEAVPVIVKSARTQITFHDGLNFDTFLYDMLQALDTTARALYESKSGAPDEIFCVLASPWYLSETRTIKMTREHSFLFKESVADELLQNEVSQLSEAYQNKYGGAKSAPEVIEHHIMGVLLNGYAVENPLGKRTRAVEMNMIISLSPKLCLDKIRSTLSKTFHTTNIDFSSFVVSSYLAVRDRYVTVDSYLLVDVGGEVTDVAIISKGVLRTSISFPFGKNTMIRYISTKLSIEMRDAQELLTLYTTDALEEKKKKQYTPLFASVENSWSEAFMQSIGTLSHAVAIPGTIFLTADIDVRGWFDAILCNQAYIQSVIVERTCTVITLEGPELLNMCKVKDGLCDPFLMIESIAVMRKMKK